MAPLPLEAPPRWARAAATDRWREPGRNAVVHVRECPVSRSRLSINAHVVFGTGAHRLLAACIQPLAALDPCAAQSAVTRFEHVPRSGASRARDRPHRCATAPTQRSKLGGEQRQWLTPKQCLVPSRVSCTRGRPSLAWLGQAEPGLPYPSQSRSNGLGQTLRPAQRLTASSASRPREQHMPQRPHVASGFAFLRRKARCS